MGKKKQTFPEDFEAARYVTNIEGWVSRKGNFYGKNESLARYDGATHKRCKCGNTHEKHYTCCDECRHINTMARYDKLKKREWDESVPVCSFDDDRYFWSMDEVKDYCEENECSIGDLMLVICEPVYPMEISEDIFEDDLPEDTELDKVDPELAELLEKVNEHIRKKKVPLSYGPGRYAVKTEVGNDKR